MSSTRRLTAALLAPLAIGAASCLVVPLPHGRPEVLSEPALSWAQPGAASRRDFLKNLGQPHFRQRDDSIFIYASSMPAYMVGFYGAYPGTIAKSYFVLARFDGRGILDEIRFEDSYDKDPCVETGFCDPLPAIHAYH